ncbi:MAG: hypothetical protein ACFB14_11285 [Leptolyngbyaceae cyanobacterium]
MRHAAALVVENATGDVLAYVGSPKYFSSQQTGQNDDASEIGGVDISLSNTLLADIKAPAKQTDWLEALPNLSTAASQLSVAASLQILSQQYGQVLEDFDTQANGAQSLQRIKTLQRPDGGLASWPGSEQSDPFVTPYAARALAQARAAGFSVDGALMSPFQKYLYKYGLFSAPAR